MLIFADEHCTNWSLLMDIIQLWIFAIRHYEHYNSIISYNRGGKEIKSDRSTPAMKYPSQPIRGVPLRSHPVRHAVMTSQVREHRPRQTDISPWRTRTRCTTRSRKMKTSTVLQGAPAAAGLSAGSSSLAPVVKLPPSPGARAAQRRPISNVTSAQLTNHDFQLLSSHRSKHIHTQANLFF